jgi:ribose 5-phosphate isomerase A
MTQGLGTGTTVFFALDRLAERVREERLEVRGEATSVDTEEKARELGIPLTTLAEVPAIDLTIDGADEIDPAFNMIKGGGGALLREKVVASCSKREVIVVGADKVVDRLGLFFLVPVEVVPFARSSVARALVRLGAKPTLRLASAGTPYLTDNQNEILDCAFAEGIADPGGLERELAVIPGLVESGLFVGLAHAVVIGSDDGRVEIRERR